MGPFVPDLISDQFNLVIALAVGFLFGYVLEQAGFSSSRRLVGIFYGYDLTVLRVFFTAASTAAVGLLLLGSAGLLDLSAVYVNPTWLRPALAGGVLMGLGFLLGGFCPGTSFCALAIGKVDALAFAGGSAVGIFAYAELYPRIASFADSTDLGSVRLPPMLGLSDGVFVLLLVLAAVGVFAAGARVEKRVARAAAPATAFSRGKHLAAAGALVAAAIVAALLPGREARLVARVTAPGYVPRHAVKAMTPDELAFRIVDRDPRLRVVDLRPESARRDQPLPGAIPFDSHELLGRPARETFGGRGVKKVLVGSDEPEARTAAYLLSETGFENLAILAGGFGAFQREILTPGSPVEGGGRYADVVLRFRGEARATLAQRILEEKQSAPAAPKPARVIKGGC